MIEYSREDFKIDPVMRKVYELVKDRHKVAAHTERTLIKNKHVKDFCEEARHFVEIPTDKLSIFIHYDVASWFRKPMGVAVKIESIGIYEDEMEYTTARLKGLHSGRSADIPNIN